MSKFFRPVLFILSLMFLLMPLSPFFISAKEQGGDEIFKARVVKILDQKTVVSDDGFKTLQQNLELEGLSDKWKNKQIIFQGIQDYQVVKSNQYKVGDEVLVAYSPGPQGQADYYIVDYVRHKSLYQMALIFVFLVIIIGAWKGLRALIALSLSFLVIMKIIVPKILSGANPLLISIVGSILILLLVIY